MTNYFSKQTLVFTIIICDNNKKSFKVAYFMYTKQKYGEIL